MAPNSGVDDTLHGSCNQFSLMQAFHSQLYKIARYQVRSIVCGPWRRVARIHGFNIGKFSAGDTIQGLKDERWVAFMLNFPLYMPLPAEQVARIGRTVKAWQFDFERLHCGWTGQSVDRNAKKVVIKSAEHYVGLLDGSVEREYF